MTAANRITLQSIGRHTAPVVIEGDPDAGKVQRRVDQVFSLLAPLKRMAAKVGRPELAALADVLAMAAERALQGGQDAEEDLRAVHRYLEGRRREVVEARWTAPTVDLRRRGG